MIATILLLIRKINQSWQLWFIEKWQHLTCNCLLRLKEKNRGNCIKWLLRSFSCLIDNLIWKVSWQWQLGFVFNIFLRNWCHYSRTHHIIVTLVSYETHFGVEFLSDNSFRLDLNSCWCDIFFIRVLSRFLVRSDKQKHINVSGATYLFVSHFILFTLLVKKWQTTKYGSRVI